MDNQLVYKRDVIDLLCKLHIDNVSVNDKRVTDYIREIPEAYNVEEVVAEVKAAKDEDGLVCYIDDKPVIHKSQAIELIRRGKVKEDK